MILYDLFRTQEVVAVSAQRKDELKNALKQPRHSSTRPDAPKHLTTTLRTIADVTHDHGICRTLCYSR